MGYREDRHKGIQTIINTLRDIDEYNLTHDDAKTLDIEKLTIVVMSDEHVSRNTAEAWIKEAIEMNKLNHNHMNRMEYVSRINKVNEEDKIKEILK